MEAPAQTTETDANGEAALRQTLAQREREIAELREKLAAERGAAASRPESTAKAALLELYWRTAGTDYQAGQCAWAEVPRAEMFRTFYLEIPATTGDTLRLDLGSEPAVWLIESLKVMEVSTEGALMEPAIVAAAAGNNFSGLLGMRGVVINAITLMNGATALRVLCFDQDPQLAIAISPEFRSGAAGNGFGQGSLAGGMVKGETRILAISCRMIDAITLLMEQSVPQMFESSGALEVRVNTLQTQVAALEKLRDELSELVRQMESVRKSQIFRFTRGLSRLYHGLFGRGQAQSVAH